MTTIFELSSRIHVLLPAYQNKSQITRPADNDKTEEDYYHIVNHICTVQNTWVNTGLVMSIITFYISSYLLTA